MASDRGGLVEEVDEASSPRPLIRTLAQPDPEVGYGPESEDPPPTSTGDPDSTGSDEPLTGANSLGEGSAWAMAVLGIVSLSGLLFWVLAASYFDEDAVGRAAAWYTLIQLAVIGSAFGAPVVINRSAGASDATTTAGAAVAVVAVLAAAAGLMAPFLAGEQWSSLADLSRPTRSLLVLFLVVGSALVLLADARLVSLRQWRWLFARAAVPSVVRVSLVFISPWSDQAAWLLIAAAAPVAISGYMAMAALIYRRAVEMSNPRHLDEPTRRYFAVQHLGAVATQIPYHVVPFLVARQVAPSTNAAFYFVWAIGAMVSMAPVVLTQVLLSESSLARTGRVTMVRATLAVNVTLVALAWGVSVLLGPWLLELFGPTYGEMADVLPFILLASLAWSVASVGLTESRLNHDNVTTTAITLTIAIGSLLLALMLMPGDPVWGAVYAWLIANVAAALVGLIMVDRRSV